MLAAPLSVIEINNLRKLIKSKEINKLNKLNKLRKLRTKYSWDIWMYVSFLSHVVLFILRQKNSLSKTGYLGRKYIPYIL